MEDLLSKSPKLSNIIERAPPINKEGITRYQLFCYEISKPDSISRTLTPIANNE